MWNALVQKGDIELNVCVRWRNFHYPPCNFVLQTRRGKWAFSSFAKYKSLRFATNFHHNIPVGSSLEKALKLPHQKVQLVWVMWLRWEKGKLSYLFDFPAHCHKCSFVTPFYLLARIFLLLKLHGKSNI